MSEIRTEKYSDAMESKQDGIVDNQTWAVVKPSKSNNLLYPTKKLNNRRGTTPGDKATTKSEARRIFGMCTVCRRDELLQNDWLPHNSIYLGTFCQQLLEKSTCVWNVCNSSDFQLRFEWAMFHRRSNQVWKSLAPRACLLQRGVLCPLASNSSMVC